MLHSPSKALTGNLLTLLFIALLGPNAFALAATETVLHSFAHGTSGSNPIANGQPRMAEATRQYSGATIRFSYSSSKSVNSSCQSSGEVEKLGY